MSELQERFQKASVDVKGLSKKPSNEDLLALYSNYKQATSGDVQGKRPGMLDIAGRAKYDAWASLKGQAPDSAMQRYIDVVDRLLSKG